MIVHIINATRLILPSRISVFSLFLVINLLARVSNLSQCRKQKCRKPLKIGDYLSKLFMVGTSWDNVDFSNTIRHIVYVSLLFL